VLFDFIDLLALFGVYAGSMSSQSRRYSQCFFAPSLKTLIVAEFFGTLSKSKSACGIVKTDSDSALKSDGTKHCKYQQFHAYPVPLPAQKV